MGNFIQMAIAAQIPNQDFPVTPPPKKKVFNRNKHFQIGNNDNVSQKSGISAKSDISVVPP